MWRRDHADAVATRRGARQAFGLSRRRLTLEDLGEPDDGAGEGGTRPLTLPLQFAFVDSRSRPRHVLSDRRSIKKTKKVQAGATMAAREGRLCGLRDCDDGLLPDDVAAHTTDPEQKRGIAEISPRRACPDDLGLGRHPGRNRAGYDGAKDRTRCT